MFEISISYLTAFAFLYYGLGCFFSNHIVDEFERYGLSKFQRRLTGSLQLLGSLGIMIGLYIPVIGFISAFGLSVLMILGFSVRIKIRDTLKQSLPSFIFIWVNAYIAYHFYKVIVSIA